MSPTFTDSTGMKASSDVRYASCMSKDKYVSKEAERAGVTTEHLLTFYEVLPCECGKSKCKGWQLRWKFGARRRREAANA